MPGANCSIVGCGKCRRHKVGIFRLPYDKPNDVKHQECREKWLKAILSSREIDQSFRDQLKNGTVYVCELHFAKDDIETHVGKIMEKKKPKPGAFPYLNLPKKSIETNRPTPRPPPKLREAPIPVTVDCYSSFQNFIARIKDLKCISGFSTVQTESYVVIQKPSVTHDLLVPQYEIVVNKDLSFTLIVFGWKVPINHHLFCPGTFKNITLSCLVQKLAQYKVCPGVPKHFIGTNTFTHSIMFKIDYAKILEPGSPPMKTLDFYRQKDCRLLIETMEEICLPCGNHKNKHFTLNTAQTKRMSEPAKPNAPVSQTSAVRLKLALAQGRVDTKQLKIENLQLKEKLRKMENELKRNSVLISDDLSNDMVQIISNSKTKLTPFMELFWQEQKKLFTKAKTGVRFHPQIIRFCLSLSLKSPSCYKELCNSGILKLPSMRTLRDYKNVITSKPGFQPEVIDELQRQTASYKSHQRYVCLLIDEMKIKSNLVFNKHTGELVGFVDLGDLDVNFATLETEEADTLASYALVFFVRGITSTLKYSLAYFSTTGATSLQMFPLFWKAVSVLEITCQLKLVAATSDGASSNRRLFRMHKNFDKLEKDFVNENEFVMPQAEIETEEEIDFDVDDDIDTRLNENDDGSQEEYETESESSDGESDSDIETETEIENKIEKEIENEVNGVVYKTVNLYARNRFIHFFSDAPHLVKTVRNCVYNSGSGRKSRHMWKDGNDISWDHIRKVKGTDAKNQLKLNHKLKREHINLTPYSSMRVYLAAQVLSRHVSKILKHFEGTETRETANLCYYMDRFFDCLNVRSLKEHKRRRKRDLKPYTSVTDKRFKWLVKRFLPFFQNWLESIKSRQGDFEPKQKAKMFISWQSHEGLQMTVYSMIDCVKFLINEGVSFVLTERFCQDTLEEYFGCQRKVGGRSDCPDVDTFGKNTEGLRAQKKVSNDSGNNRGRYDQTKAWVNVSHEPVPKRQKPN